MSKFKKICYGSIMIYLFIFWSHIAVMAERFIPNDPLYENQKYLKEIGIEEVWQSSEIPKKPIVIGVIDTGVDVNHPDLVDQILPGINLMDRNRLPIDNNGHGTNVAGVIAALANNQIGIAGINQHAKILPIKALDQDGFGDEAILVEALKYAIEQKVKIIILSLGFNKYSETISQLLIEAEKKGILIIAAAGNEGNVVKYPAAYPSVLAVGGVNYNKQAYYLSNSGPELDIVAPWEVYTTALGGGYEYASGSSMAAPQVAAVASLLISKYSELRPDQLRNLLMQSTEDIEEKGWDLKTGYGFLRADLAIKMKYDEDRFEPNNQMMQAKTIPVDNEVMASFSSKNDIDCYRLYSPYEGTVQINFSLPEFDKIQLNQKELDGKLIKTIEISNTNPTLKIQVNKGLNYIELRHLTYMPGRVSTYQFQTKFNIYADAYEDNDKQYKAYTIMERSQEMMGTFHQSFDEDWFLFKATKPGNLKIKAIVDNARMDLVITVQKKNEKAQTFNLAGENGIENLPMMDVTQGDYWIQIKNFDGYDDPVSGEYKLILDYSEKLIDPNEPNEKPYQAKILSQTTFYKGVFDQNLDIDWFEFKIKEENIVDFLLNEIPKNRTLTFALYNQELEEIYSNKNVFNEESIDLRFKLNKGKYYIKLTSNQTFSNQYYQLQIKTNILYDGFIDIYNHWAYKDIATLIKKQIVNGYDDYQFAPDRYITRAEAVSMLVRALKLEKSEPISFRDLDQNHWSYKAISIAVQNGVINGYPDGTFRPDQYLTRMEMASLIANSQKMKGLYLEKPRFTDVPNSYWGASILNQLQKEKIINGYLDKSFRPEKSATRAEFISIVAKL
jgi:hypothetical protein